MITFVFSHHCVVRFFALPASVSLSGVSGETNFLGNILAHSENHAGPLLI